MRILQNFIRDWIRDMDTENQERELCPDRDIDQRCKRTVSMEILNLSMPRTETLSMKKALQTLGYEDVYHFNNIYTNRRDADIWIELMDAKHNNEPRNWRAEFDALFSRCASVSDVPCMFFAKELVQAYPEAKVILVERDIEEWMQSMEPFFRTTFHPRKDIISILDPEHVGRTSEIIIRWQRYGLNARTAEEARENARSVYRRHYEEIRDLVPKEKLLDYRLGSGWEPLCNFLGTGVPDVPFPNINESTVVEDRTRILKRRFFWRLFKKVSVMMSLFALVKFALIWRLRARQKFRWLRNPYKFDARMLAGVEL